MDTQIVDHDLEDNLPILEETRNDNFFHAGHWGQCLELLIHLCQYGDSIILVCGPSGIGKTCMQQALLQHEADKFSFCAVNATPYLTGESLQEYIDPVIEQHNHVHKEVVLLIDDAQDLSMDVLALLLQLKQKTVGRDRLRIILFATDDLEQNAARSILKDEFVEHVHIIQIEPLTLTEVEAFLMQQWRLNNSREEFPFDKSKLKKIFALSGGIPGAVQRIAKEMLSNKKSISKRDLTEGLSPAMVGLTVSLGIIFCLLAFLWPSADDSLLKKENVTVATISEQTDPTQPDNSLLSVAAAEEVVPNEVVTGDAVTNAEANVQSSTEVAQVVVEQTAPLPEPITPNEPVAEATKELSDDEKLSRLEHKLVTLQQQLAGEQEARRAAELKYKSMLNKALTPTTSKKVQVKSIPTKPAQSKVTRPSQQSKISNVNNRNEQSILSIPSKKYTIKLLGLREESKVKEFIKKHKIGDKAQYYKTLYKGRPWYVVIYGNYNDKLAARTAVSKMSLALRKLQPWPREYSHVQNSIRHSSSSKSAHE